MVDLLASRLKAKGEAMEIKRSRPKGPAEWFSGDVAIDPLFEAPEPARVRGGGERYIPARCSHGMAYPSPRADIDRYGRPRTGAALGRRRSGFHRVKSIGTAQALPEPGRTLRSKRP